MVLIFSEDGGLQIVETQLEAVAQCEGIDVLSSVFWFFDEKGRPLIPVFDKPVSEKRFLWFFKVVDSGEYHLEAGDADHPMFVDPLSTSMYEATYLEPNPFFESLDQLTDDLRSRGMLGHETSADSP